LLSYAMLLIVWLSLVKHFFDCGWVKALLITIVAVIIAVIIWAVIGFLLGWIGSSIGWFPTVPTVMN